MARRKAKAAPETTSGDAQSPEVVDVRKKSEKDKKRYVRQPLIRSSLADKAFKREAKEGTDVTMGTSLRVVGIPFYMKLALAYVWGTSVLPLRRVYKLIGIQESGKSQLAWLLARMVVEYGGFNLFEDMEKKNSPEQIIGLLGGPENFAALEEAGVLRVKQDVSIEGVKRDITAFMKDVKAVDPHNQVPRHILLDSIPALLKEEYISSEDGKKEKHYEQDGYGAAQVANAFTKALKQLHATVLTDEPYIMTMVNHEKVKLSDTGAMGKTLGTGGAHQDFMATVILSMQKLKASTSKQWGTRTQLKLKTRKSALCETGRELKVDTFSYRRDDGVKAFDWLWGEALVDLLEEAPNFQKDKGKALITIADTKKKHPETGLRLFNCQRLKMKSATGAEIEAAIWEDEELLHELLLLLDIYEGEIFDPNKGL